jgi:AcrR family transcriptional regulator
VPKQPITDETKTAILNAAWSLMAKRKRLDIGQAEIAAAAGVSRQTVYMAFGSRAKLLVAMVRNMDSRTDHVQRLGAISRAATADVADFLRYLDVWFDYLPLIYPVGILLDAAALTDTEAARAWDDRMKGALLAGLKRIFGHLAKAGQLAAGWTPDQAAELVWSLIHPAMWRMLVVGSGWSAADFRRSRLALIQSTVLAEGAGA